MNPFTPNLIALMKVASSTMKLLRTLRLQNKPYSTQNKGDGTTARTSILNYPSPIKSLINTIRLSRIWLLGTKSND